MRLPLRFHPTFAAFLLSISALGAACGSVKATGSDGGGGSDAGSGDAAEVASLTADAACDQFARAYCGALQACAPFSLPLFYGDATQCAARIKLSCVTDQMVVGTNRTPADVAACADDVPAATCADLAAGRLPEACQIKPGAVVNGGACGSNWQCVSTHCEKPQSGNCGTCAPRQPQGGDCTVDDGCASGLACANNKCVTPGELGATCSANAPCRGDLYCDKVSRVCTSHVGPGTSCANDSNACDLLNAVGCNPFNQVCQTVGAAKGGDPCGLVNGTLVVCIAGDACPGATLIKTGACVNPAGDGEACNDMSHCLPPANCLNGLCRLPTSTTCQ